MSRDEESTYEDEVVRFFLQYAPPVLKANFNERCCIAGTRIGSEVLNYFGIPSDPVSAVARVFNQVAQSVIEKEGRIIERDHPKAKDYVDAGYYAMFIGKTGAHDPNTWDGHLVLATNNQVVDVTLGFHARRKHHLDLRPSSFERPPELSRAVLKGHDKRTTRQDITAGYDLPEGAKVIYHFLPGDKSYRESPDWKAKWPSEVADIIKQMRPHVPGRPGRRQ